jgi:uncharacterized protein (DUF427 family)
MKAIWENTVVAESDNTIVVEGNHYFPPDSIKKDCFGPSDTHSTVPLEGRGQLLSREGGREGQLRCRLVLSRTQGSRKSIKDYVAFWRGVKVTE